MWIYIYIYIYIYIFNIVYIYIYVFRPAQDSSVWLRLTNYYKYSKQVGWITIISSARSRKKVIEMAIEKIPIFLLTT